MIDQPPAPESLQMAQAGAPQIRTQEIVSLTTSTKADALRLIEQNARGLVVKPLYVLVTAQGGRMLGIEVTAAALRSFIASVEVMDIEITGSRITFGNFMAAGQ